MLGDTLKVHFAGCEQIDFGLIAHKAGVKYFLYTCFPFISKQFGIAGFPITCKTLFPPAELQRVGKHTIMDSGVFTLMFGAHAGNRDKKTMQAWQDAMVRFVLENNIQSTVVEMDCQKILGPEEAWFFRQQLRERIPNQIINVFHWEDGRKGLDRLIEYADYIAFGAPELRRVKPKTYKEDIYRLACYTKNKKPEMKIHLLGMTETKTLERCKFCTTADSTSWQAVNRFGRIMNHHVKTIRPEIKEKCRSSVLDVLDACGIQPTDKRIDYYSNYYMSAYLSKKEYERAAGDQD